MYYFDLSNDVSVRTMPKKQSEDYSPLIRRETSKSTSFQSKLTVKTKIFRRKETLRFDHYESWTIESGIVRAITWDSDGAVYTIGFWGPGDVISRSFISVNPYQVECLSPVKAIPNVVGSSFTNLETNYCQMGELLSIVQKRCTGNRLLLFIEWFNRRFATLSKDGEFHSYRLTHQEFAESICTTRVTVTRLLQSYEREGLIERSKRYILRTCRPLILNQSKTLH
jgi:CRP-like cAMP-binding protein